MDLSKIISVNVTRETKILSERAFGTMLIIGPNGTFTGRSKLYGEEEQDTLAAELTGGTAAMEYIQASTVFSQEQHIPSVLVGKKLVGDATWTAALNAIKNENANFFGVVTTSRTLADQKEVADWCQANGRVCILVSSDSDIIDETDLVDLTSIAWYVKANSLSNVSVLFDTNAATKAMDAACMGYFLALVPGSYTGAFKTLTGVTVNNLSESQSANAHSKYCSTYEEVLDNAKTFFLWTGSGEFFDIIHFAYWLVARIQEANLRILFNTLKSPMTDGGITGHENATQGVLELGITNGGISPQKFDENGKQVGGYWTKFPKIEEVPSNNKAARRVSGAKFRAWLAGAIHSVEINGVLTVG